MNDSHRITWRWVECIETESLKRTFADTAPKTGIIEGMVRTMLNAYTKRCEAEFGPASPGF
jgi:hypothetical protein